MPRRRINRAMLCSSQNYQRSKRFRFEYLNELHSHFKEMTINGEIAIDKPILEDGKVLQRYKTIRIFGKDMRVTIDEYNTHCKKLGL